MSQPQLRVESNWRRAQPTSAPQSEATTPPAESAPAVRSSKHGFNFRATASNGHPVDYYVPIEDELEARVALNRAGLKLERISPRRSLRRKKARLPKRAELIQLAEQLGDQWETGESPTQILTSQAMSTPNPLLATALYNAADDVRNGATVSEAFAAQTSVTAIPDARQREAALAAKKQGRPVFPITLCHGISIAEETGAISDPLTGEKRGAMQMMMERFALDQTRTGALVSSVRGALMYPAAVLLVIVFVVAIMLYFALPPMKDMFLAMTGGDELPLPTRILIGASDFAVSPLGVIGGLALLIGGLSFVAWSRTPKGRDFVEAKSLWLPLFGELIREAKMSQLARTFGMLAAGSGDIVFALRETARATANPTYRKMIESVLYEMETDARALSVLFRPYTPLVTEAFNSILITYESSGGLDKLCARLAGVLERRCERRIEVIKHTLNTYLIIPLAILVAGVMVALYLPMISLVGKMANAH